MTTAAQTRSWRKFLCMGGLAVGFLSVALFVLCCVVQVRSYFASDDLLWKAFGDFGAGYNGPLLEAGIRHDEGHVQLWWYCRGPFPLQKLLTLKERIWQFQHTTGKPGSTRPFRRAGTLGFAVIVKKGEADDYGLTDSSVGIMFPNLFLLAVSGILTAAFIRRHLRRRPVARFEVLVQTTGVEAAKPPVSND